MVDATSGYNWGQKHVEYVVRNLCSAFSSSRASASTFGIQRVAASYHHIDRTSKSSQTNALRTLNI